MVLVQKWYPVFQGQNLTLFPSAQCLLFCHLLKIRIVYFACFTKVFENLVEQFDFQTLFSKKKNALLYI